MQRAILEKSPSSDLKVLVVWAPNFPGDARGRWNPRLIDDPRTEHFWDEDNIIGRYLKGLDGFSRSSQSVIWDTYILYDDDATWETDPSTPVGWGATVLGKGEQLREQIAPLLVE